MLIPMPHISSHSSYRRMQSWRNICMYVHCQSTDDCSVADSLLMKNHDDSSFLSRFDESAQILEDWINRTTSEDHTQLNKLYSDVNKKSRKLYDPVSDSDD